MKQVMTIGAGLALLSLSPIPIAYAVDIKPGSCGEFHGRHMFAPSTKAEEYELSLELHKILATAMKQMQPDERGPEPAMQGVSQSELMRDYGTEFASQCDADMLLPVVEAMTYAIGKVNAGEVPTDR